MKATAVRTPRERAALAGVAGAGKPHPDDVPRPAPRSAPVSATPAGPEDPDNPRPTAGDGPERSTPRSSPRRHRAASAPAPAPSSGRSISLPAWTDNGAGFVLALLVWGWIVLPLLSGGPNAVKATLVAKFLNKGPDGKALP